MPVSRDILIGVSGGVAAYKVVEVASRLRKAGHQVQVAMTDAARQFVTPLTFAAVTGRKVLDTLFPAEPPENLKAIYPHLYPATECDTFLAAPATADLMAQLAAGAGRDAVTTSALSLRRECLRFLAPAMNVEMWEQPVVQRNVQALRDLGWVLIGPESGPLACGMTGCGRMSEPEDIVAALEAAWAASGKLAGRRLLVLSGPTHEHFDPIRFIGNPSSGKMGKAVAEEALRQGASVEFVSGPVAGENLPAGAGLTLHRVVSAQQMLETAATLYAQADVIVYVAAVADYTPIEYNGQKMAKLEGEVTLRLRSTPDIAATLNQGKKNGQVAVGFALQTHDGQRAAADKLDRKRFDGIVLNYPESLGGDSGSYELLVQGPGNRTEPWGKLDKRECARRILDFARGRLPGPAGS